MYYLKTVEKPEEIIIDPRCKEFGDTFIIILSVDEFLNRVLKAASAADLRLYYGPVTYIDLKQYNGKWDAFKKPIDYSFQNEFRFFVLRNEKQPLFLNVGSLEDISIMLDADKLEQLKFSKEKI